ncbi:MAG: mannose-1-phosphate guanylyltransferase [Clostridia bacterium]|nr:mannose-1-phosphate guanylyltransferase [Deltaproteobacteria bacterium]
MGESHADACADAVPHLPREHVLVEPEVKNTAAAIALAAMAVRRSDSNAIMVVLPADHFVRNSDALVAALESATEIAERDVIVTLGIEPTYPETGYGYIKRGATDPTVATAFAVEAFVEKPTAERAVQLLLGKDHYWNAGMFVMRPIVVEDAIRRSLPNLDSAMRRIEDAVPHGNIGSLRGRVGDFRDANEIVKREYHGLDSISIDHGVMEKARAIAVVPVSCGWSDIGSWNATGSVIDADKDGNVVQGEAILRDVKNCVVYADKGHVVGVVGVSGLVVVHTKDATLVVPADRAQDVRTIVDSLKDRGLDRFL